MRRARNAAGAWAEQDRGAIARGGWYAEMARLQAAGGRNGSEFVAGRMAPMPKDGAEGGDDAFGVKLRV